MIYLVTWMCVGIPTVNTVDGKTFMNLSILIRISSFTKCSMNLEVLDFGVDL